MKKDDASNNPYFLEPLGSSDPILRYKEVEMDVKGFKDFLVERKLAEDEIAASINLVERFEKFLENEGGHPASKAKVNAFSTQLIESNEDTLANYYALAWYGRFIGNDDIYVGVVELLDGAEALGNLYNKAEEVLGAARRDSVFEGVEIPSMGMPNQERVGLTEIIMNRLIEVADPDECDKILSDSLRDLEDAWYQDEKKLFDDSRDIDDFLDKNAQNFIALLEKIRDEGSLFFTQKITDEVLEYVRNEPLIARGVKEGNVFYEVKIPHMTVEFLEETDPQMKRYYYCHCPWVKESLKEGKPNIPATFCSCSAGFHKKRWEVFFDQPLRAEIIESVLKGDDRCKIAIHLPENTI
jgi:hypothetical protein